MGINVFNCRLRHIKHNKPLPSLMMGKDKNQIFSMPFYCKSQNKKCMGMCDSFHFGQ